MKSEVNSTFSYSRVPRFFQELSEFAVLFIVWIFSFLGWRESLDPVLCHVAPAPSTVAPEIQCLPDIAQVVPQEMKENNPHRVGKRRNSRSNSSVTKKKCPAPSLDLLNKLDRPAVPVVALSPPPSPPLPPVLSPPLPPVMVSAVQPSGPTIMPETVVEPTTLTITPPLVSTQTPPPPCLVSAQLPLVSHKIYSQSPRPPPGFRPLSKNVDRVANGVVGCDPTMDTLKKGAAARRSLLAKESWEADLSNLPIDLSFLDLEE